jgi:hypothetical protein
VRKAPTPNTGLEPGYLHIPTCPNFPLRRPTNEPHPSLMVFSTSAPPQIEIFFQNEIQQRVFTPAHKLWSLFLGFVNALRR